jgi:hypothetical protein
MQTGQRGEREVERDEESAQTLSTPRNNLKDARPGITSLRVFSASTRPADVDTLSSPPFRTNTCLIPSIRACMQPPGAGSSQTMSLLVRGGVGERHGLRTRLRTSSTVGADRLVPSRGGLPCPPVFRTFSGLIEY